VLAHVLGVCERSEEEGGERKPRTGAGMYVLAPILGVCESDGGSAGVVDRTGEGGGEKQALSAED